MGTDCRGRSLGTGLSQRKDGLYVARFTTRSGKRISKYCVERTFTVRGRCISPQKSFAELSPPALNKKRTKVNKAILRRCIFYFAENSSSTLRKIASPSFTSLSEIFNGGRNLTTSEPAVVTQRPSSRQRNFISAGLIELSI